MGAHLSHIVPLFDPFCPTLEHFFLFLSRFWSSLSDFVPPSRFAFRLPGKPRVGRSRKLVFLHCAVSAERRGNRAPMRPRLARPRAVANQRTKYSRRCKDILRRKRKNGTVSCGFFRETVI